MVPSKGGRVDRSPRPPPRVLPVRDDYELHPRRAYGDEDFFKMRSRRKLGSDGVAQIFKKSFSHCWRARLNALTKYLQQLGALVGGGTSKMEDFAFSIGCALERTVA